ncbi:MAG: hypothetical protein IJZ35_04190 [Clostridia bacterium]|nr:hypothetical protein [Clostridia bacterium]
MCLTFTVDCDILSSEDVSCLDVTVSLCLPLEASSTFSKLTSASFYDILSFARLMILDRWEGWIPMGSKHIISLVFVSNYKCTVLSTFCKYACKIIISIYTLNLIGGIIIHLLIFCRKNSV